MSTTSSRAARISALALAAAALLGTTACVEPNSSATIGVRASALTDRHTVTRMTLTAGSAGVSVELTDQGDGSFAGAAVVPVGAYTFTVDAFAPRSPGGGGAPVETRVGTGSAQATITEGDVTMLDITVFDITGSSPVPGHSPVVLSLTVSDAQPTVGETIALNAEVVDPDNDVVTYAWTATCTTGHYAVSDQATASWAADSAGPCTLRVTATAGEHSVSRAINVVAFAADDAAGGVEVSSTFVSNPEIDRIRVGDPFNPLCTIRRDGNDATCTGGTIAVGAATDFVAYLKTNNGIEDRDVNFEVTDSCGGIVTTASYDYYVVGTWRPTKRGLCLLRVRAIDSILSDTMTVAVVVQ